MAFTRLRASYSRQRGAAAIEFALVFPVFLMVLLAMVVWSTMFFVQSAMSNAAQEAVRYAVMVDPDAYEDQDAYEAAVKSTVTDRVDDALEMLPESWVDEIRETWDETDPVTIQDGFVVVELVYPDGSPAAGVADLGLFEGIGLVPEGGVSSEARMPLRTVE